MSPIRRPILSLYPETFARRKEKKASMPTAHAPKKKGHIIYRSRGKQFGSTGDSQRDILQFSIAFLLGNLFPFSIRHAQPEFLCFARLYSYVLPLASLFAAVFAHTLFI
jgi:hypothetical protein